jgi:Putative transposase of IS4/5 family (DUF4096)
MWTPTSRKQHTRKTNRYQTDVTDEEWRVIEPELPATNLTGRPRAWPMREIVNGIFYAMRAARGACCRAICRRGARSIAGLRSSGTRASRGSITPWSCSIANGSDANPIPRLRSLTARASRLPRPEQPTCQITNHLICKDFRSSDWEGLGHLA